MFGHQLRRASAARPRAGVATLSPLSPRALRRPRPWGPLRDRGGARFSSAASALALELEQAQQDEAQQQDAQPPGFVDAHGRVHDYLRISLTERCNLRCTYCMPESGVPLTEAPKLLSDAEILRIASAFVARGVRKIRLTGGEPLVRRNVVELCAALKGLGVEELAVTTNGLLLKRKLEPLVEVGGVNLLNISLDTLVPAKFELITRRQGHARVLESIHRAAALDGLARVKVNCVVQRGVNDDELVDFVGLTRDLDIEVRFIEYMPFDGNKWSSKKMLPYWEMTDTIREAFPGFARTKSLDSPNTVSKTWQVPGFRGAVGFISSMSDHFCGTCNRLRLTADGNIKACLFGNDELSLRDALRSGASDGDLADIIQSAVQRKHAKLGGHDSPQSIALGNNRPMILIGG